MKFKSFVVFLVLALFSTACYWNEEASPSQMAVQLDKGKVVAVEGPGGVYTDMGWFSELKQIDIGTLTFPVEDPEVLTSDNQAVGVKITIQARRQSDKESIENIVKNWPALVDNNVLIDTISATAREGLKNGVREFTLPQLLDDRNGLATAIQTQVQEDTDKYNVLIINVTVENVAPSAEYLSILEQTANLKAEIDKAKKEQEKIEQVAANAILQSKKDVETAAAQLLAEQAKTEIQIEIASREGDKIAAQYAIYEQNPEAYQLRRLELIQNMFSNGAVYFIPEGTDITTLWGTGGVTPLP